MKKVFYLSLLVGLYSCGPQMYRYKFSMKESEKPGRLYYENDTLSMKFNFYLEGLMIEFTNKSDEPIKIKWDELRMVENGIDKKIEHILIAEGKNYKFNPPSIFAPKSGCTDLVVYAANVYYQKEDGEQILKIKEMYPAEGNRHNRDSILNLKGQGITLHFTFEIKNVSYSRVFNFSLDDQKTERQLSAVEAILLPLSLISF